MLDDNVGLVIDHNNDAGTRGKTPGKTDFIISNATSGGKEGKSNQRWLRHLASANGTVTDTLQTSANNTGQSCERVSLTDLRCAIPINAGEIPGAGNAKEDDDFGEDGAPITGGDIPPSAYPGSERCLLVACAGKTDADVILHVSLDRSFASRCNLLFHADTDAAYFGGEATTYLNVEQICREDSTWNLGSAASSICKAGIPFQYDGFKYCHASEACVASQVCVTGDGMCPGFNCDMQLGALQASAGILLAIYLCREPWGTWRASYRQLPARRLYFVTIFWTLLYIR